MRSRTSARPLTYLFGTLALVWCGAMWLTSNASSQVQNPLPSGHKRRQEDRVALKLPQLHVNVGSEQAAIDYYKTKLVPHLNFLTPETILKSTLRDMLGYFGYSNISPSDLHRLTSQEIMAKSDAGDILAMRYFAPKITEVSEKPVPVPPGGFGWRKLVRFKARPKSSAETNGMETLLFLQNTFEASAQGDPFDPKRNVAVFNQAIVVRKGDPNTERHSLYFLTYGSLVTTEKKDGRVVPIVGANGQFTDAGPLIFSLKATFDEKDRDPETNLGAEEYFVPDSCAQCHGRSLQRAKVNFLDTDHWTDRVTPDYNLSDLKFKEEDFTALAASPHGVLYDGGKDVNGERYKEAFEIIRQFNQEVAEQNARMGATANFQLDAVKRWLDLHAPANFAHKPAPPQMRGIGNPTWDPNNESHRKLLFYLNRYCYRCHSSIRYNVFDLTRVKQLTGTIPGRVLDIENPTEWMPQDRVFPGLQVGPDGGGVATGDLAEFLALLKSIQQ